MGACTGIGKGNIADTSNRRLDVDSAVFVEKSAVPMICVFAEANVTSDVELGERLAEELDRLNDWPVFVIGR